MGYFGFSSADEFLNSEGGRRSNELIGVDNQVETGGAPNVVPVLSDDSDEYVLVRGVEEEIESDEDELVSVTLSESESEDDENESDDEYDEEEDSEDKKENMTILADAFKLKLLAQNFLHPEEKIASNGIMGRCFFDRASAPNVMLKEEADEQAMILADVKALKITAEGYLNPDLTIDEVDPAAFGRNYFAADEEAEERAKIIAEANMLMKHASNYLRPEAKVTNVDATVFGRNYFSRVSAPEVLSIEEADERAMIISDAATLKIHAVSYTHPEIEVINADPTSYGRNYFLSSITEESDERSQILAEASMFNKLASDYLHPEIKVENTDATMFGRNYFSRPDALEIISNEEAEECAEILADAASLEKEAMNYTHPEAPVDVDPTSFGRNYFACDAEEEDRAQILAEATMFKKLASDYLHPEMKVENTDATMFGRNYFSRPDALGVFDIEEIKECAKILADAASLKVAAKNYTHPEAPVDVDPTSFGRNYFARDAEEEDRAQILAEATMFKKLASGYLHPETKVENIDATLFGRNYFSRPDALGVSNVEEAEERATILADAASLKVEAMSYTHPEAPVVVDPSTFGRNYFARDAEEEDGAQILVEAAMFKKLASGYLHPEAKVENIDATLFGRNYFSRPDALGVSNVEEAEERATILADAASLKVEAMSYTHPEAPVVVDPSTFGRNYFVTVSENDEDEEECAEILVDSNLLKEAAVAYLHPENPVKSDPSVYGRNYFTASVVYISDEETEERLQILSEGDALKKLAIDYTHPELVVPPSDSTLFARNYFHTPAVSSDDVKMVSTSSDDVEAPEEEHHELFYFDDDYDQFTDMRKQMCSFNQPMKPFARPASFANFAHNTIDLKEDEEGHLSRSPSCVAFFDYF